MESREQNDADQQLAYARQQRIAMQFAATKHRGNRLLSELTADEFSAIITGAVFKAFAGWTAFGAILLGVLWWAANAMH